MDYMCVCVMQAAVVGKCIQQHYLALIIWHQLTVPHKGKRKKRKMLREKDIVSIDGKLRAVSVWVTHQERIMENTIEEIHHDMLSLPVYLEFRAEYMALNPNLPAD